MQILRCYRAICVAAITLAALAVRADDSSTQAPPPATTSSQTNTNKAELKEQAETNARTKKEADRKAKAEAKAKKKAEAKARKEAEAKAKAEKSNPARPPPRRKRKSRNPLSSRSKLRRCLFPPNSKNNSKTYCRSIRQTRSPRSSTKRPAQRSWPKASNRPGLVD